MKFLATGDIHSDKKLIKLIKDKGNLDDIDFIVLIGDISEERNDFAKLLNIFKDKEIFMVPGNHETKKKLNTLENNYGIHMIGNQPVRINEDLAFFGSNYLPIGPYGVGEEKIFQNLIDNYEAVKDIKIKIQLSHLPPSDTQISDASPFFPFIAGSDGVRHFLENFKPDFTLVGHIHESSGLEEIVNKTKVINVGKTFKIFEFDEKTKEIKIIK